MKADDEFDWSAHGMLSDEELDEIESNFKKYEDDGSKNILKYFDRIHDKLFTYNNILIAGFFALAKISDSISVKGILIPIANLAFLIYVEYRMMEKSRFESRISHKKPDEIKKYGKAINMTNVYSLLTIVTTLLVTASFLYYLFLS